MLNLGTKLKSFFGTTSLTNAQNQLLTNADNGNLTAKQLQTARNIQTNLQSTSAASFNGTANITPGVSGVLPVANGGSNNNIGATYSPTETITNLDQWKAILDKIPNNMTYEFIANLSSGVLTGDNAPTGWTRFVIRRHDGNNNCQVSAYPWIDGTVRLASAATVWSGTFGWTLNSIQLKTVNGQSVVGTGDIITAYRDTAQFYQQRLQMRSTTRSKIGNGLYFFSTICSAGTGSSNGNTAVNQYDSKTYTYANLACVNGVAMASGHLWINSQTWATGNGPNSDWWWLTPTWSVLSSSYTYPMNIRIWRV